MKPEDMFARLEPILGTKAKKLYTAWILADKDEKQELEQHLCALYVKHLQPTPTKSQVVLAPPLKEISTGDICLGKTVYNEKPLHNFYLKEKELAQHIAVFGRTGSGKTNTVRVLLKEFLKRKLPFLIFDWKKDYSQLDFEEVFAGIGIANKDILVLPIGKRNVNCLRINPLIPPGNTPPEVWTKQLCEVLTHAYLGGPGFESIFLKAIHHCYQEKGIYQGSRDYPTFRDLKEYLENRKCTGREALWMQSVMRTVNSICFGGMDETVNSPVPHDIANLLSKNVILELDAVSNADKTFLIESILLWLHHYRLENPPKHAVDNIIVIEEAHHLLRKRDGDEESLIENCLREMRSLGIGIVIVDQMPSLISKVALANTYCTIALNVKTGQDVYALSQAMLLEVDQKPMLGMLPVGEAIVKLQDRHLRPFHLKIPFFDTSGKKLLHYQPPEDTEARPATSQDSVGNPTVISKSDGLPPQMKSHAQTENDEEFNGSDEDRLLLDIAQFPTDSVTNRYKRLGLSARKGNHFKGKLIKKGNITPITFAGHNAWLRLFKVTQEGLTRLKTLGQQSPSFRRGGLEHQYWQNKLAEHYEGMGYHVEKEKSPNGHTVDIVADKGKQRIAIEIETGKSNYMENIENCLSKKQYTAILVACTTKQVAERIREETRQFKDERLRVVEVRKICGVKF